MADEVVVMRDGIIEQSGTPMEIYDNPNNLFVAQFIGSPTMNILECQVTEDNGQRFASISNTRLPLPANADLQVGQKLYYGVRPEHFQISKHDTSANSHNKEASPTGSVKVVEPTGPEIHVYLTMAGQELCAITRERLELKPGDEIQLQPDIPYVHLFDAETKKAIWSQWEPHNGEKK